MLNLNCRSSCLEFWQNAKLKKTTNPQYPKKNWHFIMNQKNLGLKRNMVTLRSTHSNDNIIIIANL